MILHADCLDAMAAMEPESVDAIVTDPPYGLGFMAKDWDAPGSIGGFPTRRTKAANTVNTGVSRQGGRQQQGLDFQKRQARDARSYQESSERWAEAAYRVAKPSAYLLSFGGTRTVHRLAAGLEDAGWIIRDMLVWAYASGFPKSKASLKPAWEPIVMARKPGPLRELAIDACRIGTAQVSYVGPEGADYDYGGPLSNLNQAGKRQYHYDDERRRTGEPSANRRYADEPGDFAALPGPRGGDAAGRWPANVILTDPIFDGGIEGVVGGGETTSGNPFGATNHGQSGFLAGADPRPLEGYGDSGTYSRFFLIPKADRGEREPVLSNLTPRRETAHRRTGAMDTPYLRGETERLNVHPTVKPVDLMRHLVRLVTPAGGTVLDPFLGSGTTGIACEMEGFDWIGIEKEAEYVAIAQARMVGVQRGFGLAETPFAS